MRQRTPRCLWQKDKEGVEERNDNRYHADKDSGIEWIGTYCQREQRYESPNTGEIKI